MEREPASTRTDEEVANATISGTKKSKGTLRFMRLLVETERPGKTND